MSLFAPLQTGCLIAFAMLLLLAAWQDLRTMHIADRVSLAIVATFARLGDGRAGPRHLSFTALGLALACAAVMFGAGAAAFAAGALGGGDVKLRPPRACSPARPDPRIFCWSPRWSAECWAWRCWPAHRSVRSRRPRTRTSARGSAAACPTARRSRRAACGSRPRWPCSDVTGEQRGAS